MSINTRQKLMFLMAATMLAAISGCDRKEQTETNSASTDQPTIRRESTPAAERNVANRTRISRTAPQAELQPAPASDQPASTATLVSATTTSVGAATPRATVVVPTPIESTSTLVQKTGLAKTHEDLRRAVAGLQEQGTAAVVDLPALKSSITQSMAATQNEVPESYSRKSVITDALTDAASILDAAALESTPEGRAGMLRKAANALGEAAHEMEQVK